VRRYAAVCDADDAVSATVGFARIHGAPASAHDRSPQDFFDIMRQTNISQRAVAEPRQFVSFVNCLHITADESRHQPKA
jgi:hypothetical protein